MNKTRKEKSYEIDMCHGPLFGKIVRFSVPFMLSTILQLLFNAADIVVVGQFAGKESLAAVGATGSLTNLLVNVFIGLSVGSNALIARYYGARQEKNVEETVQTAVLVSVISGVILGVAGVLLAKPLLQVMGTPANVIDRSAIYMRIYFAGMPAILLYNFGSSILRAVGDTKRPLYYLSVAGVVNVLMNLLFVIKFSMDVAGVALATVLSQCISAACVILCLIRSEGCYRLQLRGMRIYKDKFLGILRIGLPAGLQGALFSIANVMIQSSINSFGSDTVAGNAAAANVQGFVYGAMNTMQQTATCVISQNLGGKQYDRIKTALWECLAFVAVVGVGLGGGAALFGKQVLHIYVSDPDVIKYGLISLRILATTYFLCGMMDTMVGAIRGLGYAIIPMVVSLLGACGLRVLWLATVFQWKRTLTVLYLSYPVSWILTLSVHVICYIFMLKAVKKKLR